MYSAGNGDYFKIQKIKKEPIEQVLFYLRRMEMQRRGEKRLSKRKR